MNTQAGQILPYAECGTLQITAATSSWPPPLGRSANLIDRRTIRPARMKVRFTKGFFRPQPASSAFSAPSTARSSDSRLLFARAFLCGVDRMRTLIGFAMQVSGCCGLLLALVALVGNGATAVVFAPICTAASRSASDWTFDLWITGPLLGSGLVYVIGVIRLWSRAGLGHGVLLWQTVGFATGWFRSSPRWFRHFTTPAPNFSPST